MTVESMPKTVISWGIGIALLGGILIATAPFLVSGPWWAVNTEEWSLVIGVYEIVMALARALLAPLGAALIAAGLVMKYLDRRLAGERIADRPRRWRFPDRAADHD
ncbi:hypothetical protein [Agromyces mediolanus]|uniref:hypothetical protein n=1 Tax=Agromyces mediolanus TaxID=41986 RepID=UPI001E2CF099|nr:hypothetical protein [Agromyces mediolanus]MCD1572243.1 hypothetical protein [Agromyces mediolanus]